MARPRATPAAVKPTPCLAIQRRMSARVAPSDTSPRTPFCETSHGALSLDQNFLWRPFPQSPGHATAVDRLWHIGASTWPGPGLGAGSGTLVAHELLKPPASQRALAKLRTLAAR